MKKLKSFFSTLLLFLAVLFAQNSWGQTLVGSGQTYTTLKAAFDAINNGTLSGNIVLQITSSTTETATAVLNASGSGSASYTSVAIYPTGSGYSISGSVTGALIQLNGADNVTIDGRVSQSGAKDLIIQNANTSNATIQLTADATYNTVKYCVIKGATTSTSNGIVLISAGTSSGNDNNTIDNNDINGNASAVNCIYATGSSGIVNNAVTVSNNNIYDFRGAGSNGIYLYSYNSDWTIDGNSIYQTTSYTGVSGTTYGIQIGSTGLGNGFVIQNNKIGGSSANCTGTWTINGTATTFRFQGISINVGTSTASSIQNNTIKGFSWLSSSGAGTVPGVWCGINIASGLANVGNITGNIIGSTTGTGSITANVTTTAAVSFGIANASTSANIISKNSIGSITVTGNTTSISHGFVGIVTSSSGNTTISNNTIGSTSTSNSINASTASTNTNGQPVVGIWSSSTGTVTINNNIVANINNAYGGTGTSTFFGQLRGILVGTALSTSVAEISTGVSVVGNSIYNLTSAIPYTSTSQTSAVIGLCVLANSTSVSSTISQNFIYGITSTANAVTELDGIFVKTGTLSSGSNLIEKNFIHSLAAASTSSVSGMKVNSGKNNIQNNMIRLGVDATGVSITNAMALYGIYDNIGTNNYYHNSIYIGGAGVTNTSYSYSFYSGVTTNTRAFQNNIFVNNRSYSSAGSAYNVAYCISSAASLGTISGLTSNYNIFYANGTGGIAVRNGSTNYTLRQWRDANYTLNQDINSGYGDPNFANSTTDISATPTTYALKVSGTTLAEASGFLIASITDDIEGNTRSSLTPTDIGADAGDYTASDIFTPTFVYTNLTNTSSTSNRILSVSISDIGTGVPTTGSLMPRIWFRNFTTSSAWASTAGVLTSGDGNNGNWNFTVDYSLIGGTPSGNDVIQYYIVAQDQASTPNVWYSPFVGALHSDVNTQTTVPTTPNSYTILNTYSGNYTIPGSFSSLTQSGGLFDKINTGIVSGNITVTIAGDLSENGAIVLNQWAEEGIGNYTLTIQSDGTLRTLSNSANLAVPLIKINGADRVTIDGLSGKKLLFRNTNSTTSSTNATILFDNGSTSCTLTNCIIENNSTSASNGSVQVNTTGTNDITISSNEIRNPTGGTINDYYQGIYSNSSTNKLSISNNSIYNWTNYGIRLNAAADACTVSGNSLYRTSSWSITTVTVIAVKSGSGHTISGNNIGGNAANCGGSALTNTGNVFFMGLDVSGIGTNSTTNITNNTIQNITMNSVTTGSFVGISTGAGKINIGNTIGTGNTIGHTSNANSIQFAGTTGGFQAINIGASGSSSVILCNYNEIANISVTGNITVKAITVASPSLPATITWNNIHDISVANTGISAAIRGIESTGASAGTLTISNNTISNLSSTTTNTGVGLSSAIIGISAASTVNTQNLVSNTISGLNASTTAASAVRVLGIITSGASSTGNISKNYIYDLKNSSTGSGYIVGINAANGTFTMDNNIVSIINGSNTNAVNIYGIWDNIGATGTMNYYFNSVNIGGSAASGTLNSYTFNRSAATTVILKNNIFSNIRTGGTGKHIAIALQSNTITSDYNDLYASNPANIGTVNGGTAGLDFATWKSTVTGQDANSVSVDPAFTSDLHASAPAINNTGTTISGLTSDYNGATRTSPPDMGAYEFKLNATVATVSPLSTISTNSATLKGTVNANNESAIGTFEYGLTTSYGSTAAWTPSPVTGATTIDVTADITGLQPNTLYHYRINATTSNGLANGDDQTFTTSASSNCTFTGTASSAWELASNWDNGIPGANTNVTIPADKHAIVTSAAECNNLTIAAKGALTVNSGQVLLINGNLLLQSDLSGTASLITSNIVNGTAERYIAKDNSWHFLSSPVAAQTIIPNFAPTTCDQTFDFYKWDATANLSTGQPWVNLRATATTYEPTFGDNFEVGKGYLVAYSNTYGGNETHEFTGTLNSGDKSIAVVYDANNKFNLIGNPYPSAIDWNASGYTNRDTYLKDAAPSIWIWNGITGQYGAYIKDAALGTNDVTSVIAPNQAFFVEAQANGNFTIPNDARVHPGTQNFLKSTPVDLLKLKVTSTANTYSDEIIVNFNSNATANQGAAKWFSMIAQAPSLYSVKNNKNFSINTLAAINADLIVPVGFKAGVNGNYSIKASELASFSNLSNLILKDLQTGITQNLLQNPVYNFASSTADNANRFQLIFNSTSGINNLTNNSSVIYYADNQIQIQSNNQIERLEIYNAIGQLVYQSNTKSNQLSVNVSDFTRGTYIVRLIANQKIQTQKLIINN